MHGDLLIVVLILVLGCAAFFIGVIHLACRLIGSLGRSFLGLIHPRAGDRRPSAGPFGRARMCPRESCHKVEYRPARFCSQCGARLG